MVRLNRTNSHAIDTFFLLALLALFAITSFLVIIIGAKQYHTIANHMTENYETRTISSYLAEKFNQNDVTGSVSVTDIDGIPALAMTQSINGQNYTTYIYAYDGYLREAMVSEHTPLTPEFGQKIIETHSLTIETCSSNLFRITITDTFGNSSPIYISWNAK